MRLLADQDVYAATVQFLRGLGHDVLTVAELTGSASCRHSSSSRPGTFCHAPGQRGRLPEQHGVCADAALGGQCARDHDDAGKRERGARSPTLATGRAGS